MKPSDKCTNNTGFSFSSGNGTYLGWDSNGTPCSINANKPTTSISSYYPNVSSGYNATARSYIGGLDDRFEPFKLTESTNPYLNQLSSFPTFTPPVFQTPVTNPIQSESKNIPYDLIPYFESHSGKVIGWLEHQNNTLNLNFNITGKDLDMSNKQITDENMLFFCQKMASFTFHFNNFIISNNLITDLSVQYLFNATLTAPTHRTIKNLDLRNNQIGDVGAELIAAYLKHGYMPATTHVNLADNIITDKGALCFAESLNSSVNKLKVLHLEGNKITKTGEGFLVKSLKQISQDIMVILEKYSTDLGQKVIKPALKYFVKHAEEHGVDTTHVATNKPTLSYIKDTGIIIKNIAFGYAKCSNIIIDMLSFDTTLSSLAKSSAIEMYGSKAVKNTDLKVCVTLETYDAIVSPEGVDLAVKAIDLLGDVE